MGDTGGLGCSVEFGGMGRFSGCIEYFQKNSRDLLFNVPQVLSSGVSSLWMNVGLHWRSVTGIFIKIWLSILFMLICPGTLIPLQFV